MSPDTSSSLSPPGSSPTDTMSFDYGPPAPTFTDKLEERQYLKERLALAYRVIAHENMCEGSAGHLTVRDPIRLDCFWVNPFGLHFSRMTASDLLLIDHAGAIVAGGTPDRQRYNAAAFVIHSAVHAARPEVNAVVHAHSPSGKAWASLGRAFPFYTQDSAVFYDDIGHYAAHGGVVLSSKESGEIVRALGNAKALVMQNHGLLTVGGCVESAVAWFMLLENECKCILAAEAAAAFTGRGPVSLQADVAHYTWQETGSEDAGRFESLAFVRDEPRTVLVLTQQFDLVEEECDAAHKR